MCQFESAANRLNEAANLISKSHEYFHAKERLQILLSGQSTDIFSAEVRYHMSCYKRFISVKRKDDFAENREQKLHECAFNDFLAKVDLSIVVLIFLMSC